MTDLNKLPPDFIRLESYAHAPRWRDDVKIPEGL